MYDNQPVGLVIGHSLDVDIEKAHNSIIRTVCDLGQIL